MAEITHSLFTWRAAGMPDHGLPVSDSTARRCATCGMAIKKGVAISEIETSALAGHVELFRYGGQHVCDGCAWLFGAGKGRPGNYIAYGDRLEYTVISLESVVADKRPWQAVLADVARCPADTPIAGVMTTDVKPRLWHRTRLARRDAFGLYVHAPEYDVSEWVSFSLDACLDAIGTINAALALGFAKASCYYGLLRDYARAAKALDDALRIEAALSNLRREPHFLPALIAAGVTKETKDDVKHSRRPDPVPQPCATVGHQPDQAQLGLF